VHKRILINAKLKTGKKKEFKKTELEEVLQGGEGPHRNVVLSKKRMRRRKMRRRNLLTVSRINSQ